MPSKIKELQRPYAPLSDYYYISKYQQNIYYGHLYGLSGTYLEDTNQI